MYIYIYIYRYTHICLHVALVMYIYIYIYICVCKAVMLDAVWMHLDELRAQAFRCIVTRVLSAATTAQTV